MRKLGLVAATAMLAMAFAGAANATFELTYQSEAPGIVNTSTTLTVGGVETFDGISAGNYPTLASTFGNNGVVSGVYTSSTDPGNSANSGYVQVNPADQYGAAGGTGNYIVALNDAYTLTLATTGQSINYFGYWLSALDAGNVLLFENADNQVEFTFNASDVLAALPPATASGYYGNPEPNFTGDNNTQPYVFLNFYDLSGSFTKIVFEEDPLQGGYESDNQTVGHYTTVGPNQTTIPLTNSMQGVPEPAAWSLMLIGFGALGVAMRSRRRQAVATA
jgi:hypothetical protein